MHVENQSASFLVKIRNLKTHSKLNIEMKQSNVEKTEQSFKVLFKTYF